MDRDIRFVNNKTNKSMRNSSPRQQPPASKIEDPRRISFANKNLNASPSASSLSSVAATGHKSHKRSTVFWRNLVEHTPLARVFRNRQENNADGGKKRLVRGGGDGQFNDHFKYCDNSIKTSRYTIWTFIPLNLLEQCLRITNVFYIVVIILEAIPIISPLSPLAVAMMTAFVMGLTAVKYGIDDVLRHRSDNKVNNREANILVTNINDNESTSTFKRVSWRDIQVGQVVALKNNESIPADLLLLSTSDPTGVCFIETAELDGETTLKYRQCLQETQNLGDDLEKLWLFQGEVECDIPNNHLTKFNGRLDWQGASYSLNNNNILLRGCTLRNTQWAFGLVIYTGRETKLMKNAGKAHLKRTRIERLSNKFFVNIIVFTLVLMIIASIMAFVFENDTGLRFKDSYSSWPNIKNINPTIIAVLQFFSYFILLHPLLPITLYITFEGIQAVLSSVFINNDIAMYYAKTDTPASARSTSLNEDLGQIEYIFSDKTGTLTQNVMTFNMCSIGGKLYGQKGSGDRQMNFSEVEPTFWDPSFLFYDKRLLDDLKDNAPHSEKIADFFLFLALCHTLNAEVNEKGKLVYQGQSPDEAAIVMAARNFGFVYKSRTQSSIAVQVMGEERVYNVLCVLEFDTVRKRMSVVVSGAEEGAPKRLLCKGADSSILPFLSEENDNQSLTATKEHIHEMASDGLRILCCASRVITDSEWDDWFQKYQHASTALDDRDTLLTNCYLEIEKDFDLIGVTAVEDKLQEGVPEAIGKFKSAGIKVWVLTGDKQETAISIGHSCNMLHEGMEEFIVDGEEFSMVDYQLSRIRERIDEEAINCENHTLAMTSIKSATRSEKMRERRIVGDNYALIINGHSLYHALTDELEDLFLGVACSCQAVICCRVAPLQKGSVVELVKRKKDVLTLAIGDGANDVNMIKTADVGVGISGQEGRQAVLASDFALAQFRFLQQLLFVHGRWAYRRVSLFMHFFFYKTFACALCQFWYAIYCGWSGTSIFDQWYITSYNIAYTATPVFYAAVIGQDVNAKLSLKFPKLYQPGLTNQLFNLRNFLFSECEGVWSSVVVFFIMRYGFADYSLPDGNAIVTSRAAMGVAVGSCLVFVVTARCNLEISYWTWLNITPVLSLVAAFLMQYLFAVIFATLKIDFEFYGIAIAVWSAPNFWLVTAVAVAACCLPAIFIRFVRYVVYPTLVDRIQLRHQLSENVAEDQRS